MAEASHKELQRHLRYWQKRLRLTDWTVTIRFASKKELCDGDEDISQGLNVYNLNARTSEILVIRPDDYDPSTYPNKEQQDIENTVVHELLHLHLAPWQTESEAEDIQQEQAIEAMSYALVSLKRRQK